MLPGRAQERTRAHADADWQLTVPARPLIPYSELLRSLDALMTAELR